MSTEALEDAAELLIRDVSDDERTIAQVRGLVRQAADARWDVLKAFLDSEVADLRAEMETETVLMRRNLQRQAKVLSQVREHMNEMEEGR